MKNHITFFVLLLPALLFSQVFQDNFNDGSFTNNPEWFGDTSVFVVNQGQELQLNDTVGGTAQLYAPLVIADSTVWEFYFRMEFAPSTSNQLRVYLSSDATDLSGSLNGYYLEIGASAATDALKLYQQTGTTKTLLLTGTVGAVANDPALASVRIIRNDAGDWQLLADYTGGINYTLEGTATDNTHPTGSFFGVYCKYTSTRKDKFYFDNIQISPLFTDTEPPTIDTVFAVSDTEVDVYFNEFVDQTTAEDINNYLIDGVANAMSATRDANNFSLVHLTLSFQLTNNQTYTVTVSNIDDENGNTQTNDQKDFTFLDIQTAAIGDILINEILADPTPSVGLPEFEFVELYNASNKTIDLSTLIFYNSSNAFLFPFHLMQANEYVILCNASDVVAFSAFGVTVLGISGFSALSNGGDDLMLENDQSEIIHEVNYTSSWYADADKSDGGYALELKNPTLICLEADNWQASNATIGGTPGQQNSVFDNTPDLTAPIVTNAFPLNNQMVEVTFSEIVDAVSMQNVLNYSINNGIGNPVNVQIVDDKTIELVFTNSFQNQTTYELSITDIEDCSGNVMNLQTLNFDYVETEVPERYDILITEIYADPTPSLGLPEVEYVELYNRSNKAINLQEVRFSNKSTTIDLPFYVLESDEYVIIYEEKFGISFSDYGKTIAVTNLPAFANSVDELTIIDLNENTIHTINYTTSWYQDNNKSSGGFSLEMKSFDNFCQSADNWSASTATIGGTPGQQNSVYENFQDIQSPKLIRAFPISSLDIRLFFNEALDETAIDLTNFSIIDGNQQVISAVLEAPSFNTILLTLNAVLEENTIYTIEISNQVQDCLGNSIADKNSAQIALANTDIRTNDVLINEILFNPKVGGSDFLELYNASDKIFNLADFTVANTDNGLISSFENIETDYLFFPQTYIVISADILNVKNEYLDETANDALLLENDLPTFPDDEGGVLLLYNGSSIDGFEYSNDWHHTLIVEEEGISLERVDFNTETQNQDNWHSAASDVGYATPSYKNSQFIDNDSISTGEVWLTNKTFSPDFDGFQDFLLINYQVEQSGFTANIDIYDANGRWTKRIAKNEILGIHGFYKWDGTTDNGTKARMGIYIVFVELVHPSGTVQRIKKTAVLANKQ